jgi:hypothetical protein
LLQAVALFLEFSPPKGNRNQQLLASLALTSIAKGSVARRVGFSGELGPFAWVSTAPKTSDGRPAETVEAVEIESGGGVQNPDH